MDAMSKKEKLARGSAVIKVMRVNPRPGHFLKNYVDPRKLPKSPNPNRGTALESMPHLDIKNANFSLLPNSAKIAVPPPNVPPSSKPGEEGKKNDPCGFDELMAAEVDPTTLGLPNDHELIKWFDYRLWAEQTNPARNSNIADHFNVLLGLLITMAEDAENENFPDTEAFPAVQFLRTIKTPDGEIPYNMACYIKYIEYIATKILEES